MVVPRADLTKIRRLVFVCHGNICRSSYADVLAQDIGLNSASFGLSTTSGLPAHPPVTEVARELNVDLTRHRTTAVGDFQARPDDLMLVMEVRQIARLHSDPRFDGLQIDLLGRYAGVPHLHDPYRLSESYVRTCLKRIDHAVRTLAILVPGTKAS
ncbi:phosphotyrosine protein phosphatase [Sphingomonas sp.]|uniref:arsenate-mycothiol transferase ArsC n=1 Tax=Sphingomonas sp. TaxID=28214 RepID=UPI0025F2F3B3|nr:phosphotyrosine protein phosphatase [Sphingomonas sp.]